MTSPVDTSVKFFHFQLTSAPSMNGTAGSMIAVLDACLVNGFGLKTADSLVVAGGVATFNVSSGHSAEVGQVQLVAGATPANLNGEQKVTAITGTSWSFATAEADGTATGTITGKVAPAGWTKDFTATNLAAYRGIAGLATRMYLRVDDSAAKNSRIVGYETMTDINTGTGPFPTTAQMSGGLWWGKNDVAASTPLTDWILAADGGFLILITRCMANFFTASYTSKGGTHGYAFGDVPSYKVADAYFCMCTGEPADATVIWGVLNGGDNLLNTSTAESNCYVARAYTQTGGSIKMRRSLISAYTPAIVSGSSGNSAVYPGLIDGSLLVQPFALIESVSGGYRGNVPGIYGSTQYIAVGAIADRDSIPGAGQTAGRTLKAAVTNVAPLGQTGGMVMIDGTGPWR